MKPFPVETGTGPISPLEVPMEVGHVFKPGGEGDLGNTGITLDQLSGDLSDAGPDEVLLESDAQMLAEETAQGLGVQGGHPGDFDESDFAV